MHKKNAFGVLLGLGLVVLIVVLFQYNSDKSKVYDGMTSNSATPPAPTPQTVQSVQMSTANTLTQDSYLPVSGSNNATPPPPVNLNPSDLLPSDSNSEWASINPASNDLQGINLLTAGQLIGINTVGNTLRNPNLQIRSEPVIPKMDLGPWNQSTMEPDMFRRPLEIGGAGSGENL